MTGTKMRITVQYWTTPPGAHHACPPASLDEYFRQGVIREMDHEPHMGPETWKLAVYHAASIDGSSLYVGRTRQWAKRLREHRCSARWWSETSSIAIALMPCTKQAIAWERSLIHSRRPPHNRAFNPDWKRS